MARVGEYCWSNLTGSGEITFKRAYSLSYLNYYVLSSGSAVGGSQFLSTWAFLQELLVLPLKWWIGFKGMYFKEK